MKAVRTAIPFTVVVLGLLASENASAQVYTSAPGNIPQGAPFNTFVAGPKAPVTRSK